MNFLWFAVERKSKLFVGCCSALSNLLQPWYDHFLAVIGRAPTMAYPILAEKGHAAKGWSTLTGDRVLAPNGEYPILAKNGHTAKG